MNIDEKLDKLKKITPVEAPPYLYTRVQQKIDSLSQTAAPVRWRLAFAFTGIVLIAINLFVLFRSQPRKAKDMEQVVNAMQLSSSNELYHE